MLPSIHTLELQLNMPIPQGSENDSKNKNWKIILKIDRGLGNSGQAIIKMVLESRVKMTNSEMKERDRERVCVCVIN